MVFHIGSFGQQHKRAFVMVSEELFIHSDFSGDCFLNQCSSPNLCKSLFEGKQIHFMQQYLLPTSKPCMLDTKQNENPIIITFFYVCFPTLVKKARSPLQCPKPAWESFFNQRRKAMIDIVSDNDGQNQGALEKRMASVAVKYT